MTLGESRVERVGVTATPARAVCWRACRPGRWRWWWNRWPRLSSTAAARAAGRTRSRSAAHGQVRCSRTMIGRAWLATQAPMCHSSIPQPLGSPQRAHRPAWLHRHPTSSCDLACPPAATPSRQHIPCHLPSATHSRAANGWSARVSPRSARVCPPGSSQGAGAAQGRWGPSTAGRGQHHLDRVLGVGLPGGMDGHRPGARPGPNPVAHHLATLQQRGRGTALVARPGALGDQRPGGHSDRG